MVRGHLMAAALMALSLGGCATVVPASWRAVPDGEAMADAYPGFAADAGVEGRASLVCIADATGRLGDCRVDEVRPTGLGFDAAALSLTRRFEAVPETRNGTPVPSEVSFRIAFALPPLEPVAPWTGTEPSDAHLAVAREIAPRFVPGLGQGPEAISLDGLDADRVEAVQAMIARVEREFRTDAVEATARAMARTVPPETLQRLMLGQRRPPRPNMTDAELASAGDRVLEVQLRANARLNALYCAAYDCDDGR